MTTEKADQVLREIREVLRRHKAQIYACRVSTSVYPVIAISNGEPNFVLDPDGSEMAEGITVLGREIR